MHSGLSVGITNQLILVVFSCNSGGNIVVLVVGIIIIIIGGVDDGVSDILVTYFWQADVIKCDSDIGRSILCRSKQNHGFVCKCLLLFRIVVTVVLTVWCTIVVPLCCLSPVCCW